ncbi:MAG: hypothetical protein NTW03_19550, partial [Verrucomicrobia bacterium]|nr:hypothetical protein [Verrucomicrobiota bacterium]
MSRPWKTWLVFGACFAVLLAAMGWISLKALTLDRAQAEARRQSEFEEKVRLALWRMESMLAPIIAQESARPYFVYRAFYATERAYNRMFNEVQPGEVLVPSPLLIQVSSNVLLHFQLGPDGQFTSPQVPVGSQRAMAVAGYTTPEKVGTAAGRLRQFEQLMRGEASPELGRLVRSNRANRQVAASGQVLQSAKGQTFQSNSVQRPDFYNNGDVLMAATPPPELGSNPVNPVAGARAGSRYAQGSQGPQKRMVDQQNIAQQQAELNQSELDARNQSVQQAFVNVKDNLANYASVPRVRVAEGLVKPVWFGDALVLARRVSVQGVEYLQGCWLDWPALRAGLLEGVRDLLPAGALQPMTGNGADPQARMLASLPVRFVPGADQASSSAMVSPIRFALLLAWGCLLLATAAVAALLHGALSLSERRGAFVSAVTHELRTPLTTFKMYSEMLAEGMVPDEAQRRHYLATLCSEANRLSHLVENVLAYARLERGNARRRVEKVTFGELIERVKPRLCERAGQAGLALIEEADEQARRTIVHVDVSAVEQILFNLVDNSCKYAGPTAT